MDWMTFWTMVTAIAAGIGVLITALAIWQNVGIQKKQEELTKYIHSQQTLLSQRQILLPLWEHLKELNDVNPSQPVWPDVIKAVNTLELVAVCWEGQVIDEHIIRRIFKDQFINLYRSIEECKNPPPIIKQDGKQMLFEAKAAIQLYRQLTDEYIKQDQLTPLTGKRS